ncbi:GD15788 [Drosophila simulans]|uniref:GD15788 n=1 Tax=Drosophila simulans TaxID=7240 RepID=B4R5F6_DROSI|nr:GD15788 [Drosophila simulans]
MSLRNLMQLLQCSNGERWSGCSCLLGVGITITITITISNCNSISILPPWQGRKSKGKSFPRREFAYKTM